MIRGDQEQQEANLCCSFQHNCDLYLGVRHLGSQTVLGDCTEMDGYYSIHKPLVFLLNKRIDDAVCHDCVLSGS
jgi:hypothetical protein